jgi:hypothetical protein
MTQLRERLLDGRSIALAGDIPAALQESLA